MFPNEEKTSRSPGNRDMHAKVEEQVYIKSEN